MKLFLISYVILQFKLNSFVFCSGLGDKVIFNYMLARHNDSSGKDGLFNVTVAVKKDVIYS